MGEPKRLLDGGTDFERQLLEGGLSERPNAKLTRSMAMGVGLSGALTYSSTAKAVMQTWWGKAAVALTAGAGVAGMVALSTGDFSDEAGAARDAAPAPAVATTSTSPEATVPDEGDKRISPAPGSEQIEEPTPVAPKATRRTAPAPEPAARKPAAQRTLAREIQLLDRARALIRNGDTAGAAAVLDSYQRRYPKGVLQREARVLRARTLE